MIAVLNRSAYFLCTLFSVGMFYSVCVIKKNSTNLKRDAYKFIFSFLILYWTILLGSQDGVGTDYETYFEMFSKGCPKIYYVKGEIGFAYIVDLIFATGIHGQFGFVLFSFIQSICFCIFYLDCKFRNPALFLLIYFCCATSFINSQNALRQFTAMYIFLLGIKFLYEYKHLGIFKYICIILLASIFHISATLLVVLIFLIPIFYKIEIKFLFIFIFISLVLCLKGVDTFVVPFVENTPYRSYLNSVFFIEKNHASFINIVTEIIYLPFYIHLLLCGYTFFTVKKDKFYINFGIIAFCIKIISMSSFFLRRFVLYFDCLGYIPLYYYVLWLKKNKKMKKYEKISWIFLFLCIVILPYIVKTLVFPVGEYDYKSILF